MPQPPAAAAAGGGQGGSCPGLTGVFINVRGLVAASARARLFAALARERIGVAVLAETHCRDDATANTWLRQGGWKGDARWAHGSAASRGVGVLLSSHLQADLITTEYSDDEGRLLRVGWRDAAARPWAVVAAYAPNDEAAQRRFFGPDGPLRAALASGNAAARVLLCGDFNCILEPEDTSSQRGARDAAAPPARALRSALVDAGLSDAWLESRQRGGAAAGAATATVAAAHAACTRFTHPSSNGTARRLDRVYVSSDLLPAVRHCRHQPLGSWPGDHCAVLFALGEPRPRAARAPLWRLPLGLLGDDEYTSKVRADLRPRVHALLA